MRIASILLLVAALFLPAATCRAEGLRVGQFPQEVRVAYTTSDGLADNDVLSVAAAPDGAVYAGTRAGLSRLSGRAWTPVEGLTGAPVDAMAVRGADLLLTFQGSLRQLSRGNLIALAPLPPRAAPPFSLAAGEQVLLATADGLFQLAAGKLVRVDALDGLLNDSRNIRQVAIGPDGAVAVAAASGLFLREASRDWRALYPRQNGRSWAPHDVRGVAFDAQGRLWFASLQGLGCRDGEWKLYTVDEGLPYNDFTTLASGEKGVVWFGTKRGAIRYDGRNWEYRQGRRWLPEDTVRAISVTPQGCAWFATAAGVGVIERKPITLAEKARFFEDEIDRYHRRTPYQYVLSVRLKRPGDKSEWIQHDSDNDGLWTAMYGAGECFAYAATKHPMAKRRARQAFEALRFLGTVTQGGEHPAPPGFVARTILPTSGPDPNASDYTKEKDEARRATRDSLWKVLSPRWPKSADGKWYWKTDVSSDELDGHFFFYAQYYDLAAETPQEKEDVRKVVAGIAHHLLAHNFTMVDWDGKATRWAIFGPDYLNRNPLYYGVRGLNSLSILSYLKVAEHLTGDTRYTQAIARLISQENYHMNLLVPKIHTGPGSGNQSDDEMAFMCYYNLLNYEKDPALLRTYAFSLANYWNLERMELNPLFNFIAAARNSGKTFGTAFARLDLSPKGEWLEESVDTLKRYPLDRVDWRMSNSQRIDLMPLPMVRREGGSTGGSGCRKNGKVLPIDERFVEYWNHDPYRLDQGGQGLTLADGASFLLPYYLGLYHGFVLE